MQKQGPGVGKSNILILEMLYLLMQIRKEIPIKMSTKEIQDNTQRIFRL